jgi:integrase
MVWKPLNVGTGLLGVGPLQAVKSASSGARSSCHSHRYPRPKTTRFFVSSTGTALRTGNLDAAFAEVLELAGLSTSGRRPRLGDFRHSFAVAALVAWHLAGDDVNAKLPVLSALLGHSSPTKGSQTVFA